MNMYTESATEKEVQEAAFNYLIMRGHLVIRVNAGGDHVRRKRQEEALRPFYLLGGAQLACANGWNIRLDWMHVDGALLCARSEESKEVSFPRSARFPRACHRARRDRKSDPLARRRDRSGIVE